MLLRVGRDSLQGGIGRYPAELDLLEVRAEPGALPRAATLHGWREQASEQLVFSVMLGSAVGRLVPGAELDTALELAIKAARALDAKWLVLQTSPSVTPSKRNRQRLEELVRRLPGESWRVAWEPHGLWEPEQEEAICAELDMTLVRDLRRHDPPPGKVVYTRLLALGTGVRFSLDAAAIVAQRAEGFDELYVVVEGEGACQGARALRQLLQGADAPE